MLSQTQDDAAGAIERTPQLREVGGDVEHPDHDDRSSRPRVGLGAEHQVVEWLEVARKVQRRHLARSRIAHPTPLLTVPELRTLVFPVEGNGILSRYQTVAVCAPEPIAGNDVCKPVEFASMGRVDPLPIREWPPAMREALAAMQPPEPRHPVPIQEGRPKALNTLGTFAHHPALARAYFTFNGHVMLATTLTLRQRASSSSCASLRYASVPTSGRSTSSSLATWG